MISGDIFNEQLARYKFSSDFASKRVLNITNNRFVDYFNSRLLLRKARFRLEIFTLATNVLNRSQGRLYIKPLDEQN